LLLFPTPFLAQTPSDGGVTEERVTEMIRQAEKRYKAGKELIAANKFEQASQSFNKAMDVILTSGIDVRQNVRLQRYYLELILRIYRAEVDAGKRADADADKREDVPRQEDAPERGFTPSPLDELSKLVLTPDEREVKSDDIEKLDSLRSDIDFNFTPHPLVEQYINYYKGRGRAAMARSLQRYGQFRLLVRKIFREEGVPEDLVMIAQVSSDWQPSHTSWANGAGMWDFIPVTGLRFGLRQTAYIDERRSFEKATRAAARYLKWLHDRFGNWELAIAAFNTGEGNIDRAISRAGVRDFWSIYPYIAQETRNYVPNILATILIEKNPERYGFQPNLFDPPLTYDTISVPDATELDLVARASDTNIDYIRFLNPEMKRDSTPNGEAYLLRVPAGKGRRLVQVLKQRLSQLRNRDLPRTLVRDSAFGSRGHTYRLNLSLSADPPARESLPARDITQKLLSSIVLLDMSNDGGRPLPPGRGFFVRPDVIATSAHIIKDAAVIRVKFFGDAKAYPIKSVVGFDERKDLALLKVGGAVGRPLRLGDSGQTNVGDEVFALCNAQGSGDMIMPGVVTGVQKSAHGGLIQFTSPASLSGTGGPVINRQGQVIGIVTFFTGEQNFNFAVPSSWLLGRD
jgi:membrane-bound lytic murein transglycosylase D